MQFLPRYYLFGFTQGSMNNNTALPQTIGWEDTNKGGMGTFDPLAETSLPSLERRGRGWLMMQQ